ncbi:hypothetical protein SLEP1_g41940 [Rubroshorea leprosula]|uniref:Uncharacterized protein n=1 Tax=Rubroshorea leprosula TaxID=152421 RepID=A0AAV5L865_9ROSI|nr:hypothetical protein SLEP1_g41940 [Rubroshorea leprosula]
MFKVLIEFLQMLFSQMICWHRARPRLHIVKIDRTTNQKVLF